MVRKLIKKVIDSLTRTKSVKQEKNDSWEKRKAELLNKARNLEDKTNDLKVPATKKNEVRKQTPRKNNSHKKGPHKNKNVSKNVNPKPAQQRKPEAKKKRKPGKKKLNPTNWDPKEFNVEPIEGKLRFHDLDLSEELMHAIYDLGFKYCTPIQQEIIKSTLSGKDAMGRAQTGTGKTAAFLIAILDRFQKNPISEQRKNASPRALIIAPTRELVMQITNDAKKLSKYLPVQILSVFGGMNYKKQRSILSSTVIDIIVATPGRLLDFHKKRGLFLNKVEILVIDEADRMLDMGFIPDVRNIIRATPPKGKRQTLFFSATLTSDIKRLASYWTNDAVHVDIDPGQVAVNSVEQIVYIVSNDEKFRVLYNILNQKKLEKVLVFTNRRDETRELETLLNRFNINCAVLSGDVEQRKRISTLKDFKEGKIRVLVATDVAGRGIHVEGISHVINYTLPEDAEDYVHRIGRTGRAGALGISISFASEDDSFQIPSIEKYIGNELSCVYPDDDLLKPVPEKLNVKNNKSNN